MSVSNKCKLLDRLTIKSKTNDGDLSKQYFNVVSAEDKETSLIVDKFILLNDDFCKLSSVGFELVKTYKNVGLYRKTFSIKLSTLSDVFGWLRSISNKKK